jgi:3-hydroxyacyl-[acyl-carrier-protein] dehydratase
MAQLGALFAKLSVDESERGGLIVFSGAESVKFRKQVLPGDTLKIVCGNCKTRLKHWKIEASAYVGETKVASATLLASQVD